VWGLRTPTMVASPMRSQDSEIFAALVDEHVDTSSSDSDGASEPAEPAARPGVDIEDEAF